MPRQTGIRKLPSGHYKARYFAGFDANGKRRYPSRVFKLMSDAVKWRAAQVDAKGSGRHFEIHNLTVARYLDQWLSSKKQSLRENSFYMYTQTLDAYVKPLIGHLKLSRLRPSQIEAMQTELLGDELALSASTVLSARILLNGALKKAVRLGLIPTNPVTSTDGPKRPKPVRYPLSVEEALRFADECEPSRFGLFFLLMLATGLRPEECVALQWPDLELGGKRGVVNVNRVIHALRGGGWRWHEPKTKNGARSVVFPGELAAKLTEHRRRQLEQKLKTGPSWQNNDLVFCTSLGTPILTCALHNEFKAVAKRAGLPDVVRLYDLRHSFVTLSLIADVDAKTVSQEAGHASVAFTLDHYGHVLKEMHEAASDKREKLLKGRAASR
jgi:integrase